MTRLHCGLVFYRSLAPLDSITCAITKQDFSSIGIYYQTSIGGCVKDHVLLWTMFGVPLPSWYTDGMTIDDLSQKPEITRLAIKTLQPVYDCHGCFDEKATEERVASFRAAVADVVTSLEVASATDQIYQLFGYRIYDNGTDTAISMINRIVKHMEEECLVPQSDSKSDVRAHQAVGNDVVRTQTLFTVANAFDQHIVPAPGVPNKVIQSYLDENRLFGCLEEVKICQASDVEIQKRVAELNRLYVPFLRDLFSKFIELFMTDSSFAEVVSAHLSANAIASSNNRESLVDILEAIADGEGDSQCLAKSALRLLGQKKCSEKVEHSTKGRKYTFTVGGEDIVIDDQECNFDGISEEQLRALLSHLDANPTVSPSIQGALARALSGPFD